jgi:Na+-driven multidrug efflux pump
VIKKDEIMIKSWFFFDHNTTKDLWPYLKLGLNCAILLILEWWCFEIMGFFTIYLGVIQNATHAIFMVLC